MIEIDTSGLDQIAKDLEAKLIERSDAIFSYRDVQGVVRRIKEKAKTGKTGFIFRTDYSKRYKKSMNKASGNYLVGKTGKMLNSINYQESKSGADRVYRIFIPDRAYPGKKATTADVARYHNEGTAKGGKIRHFFDISDAEKKSIMKTVKKRIRKILNS